MSSDWNDSVLSDVIDFNPKEELKKGKTAKKIAMEELHPFDKKVNGFTLAEYSGGAKFRNGDTLLARITPCLENGKTAYVDILEKDEIAFGSTEFIVMRAKTGITDEAFIYYLATSPAFRAVAIQSMTGTSGRQRVQNNLLENAVFRIPTLPEQRAIAATLSALDDKIELNNRINKTLEEMAQALFKQWFVDFEFPDENGQPYKSSGGEMEESELGPIPKGWKVGELDQVIEIYDSQRIPLAGNVRSGRKGIYPYYGAATIMDYIDTWIFDGVYLLLAEDGSVVTANDGPVLQYAWGKFWVNNHAHVLQGKNGFSVEQLLLLLQRVNVRPYITGAVQLKINQANLKRIPVVIPAQDICLNFNKVIEKQFAMIRDNINETNILGILRDALLPKLMSGEIRVPIEEVAADV